MLWLILFDFFTVSVLVPVFFGLLFGLAGGWLGFVIGFSSVSSLFVVLAYAGVTILWFLLLLWLYDLVVGFAAWLLRWHFNVFSIKQGPKIVKRIRQLRVAYYLRKRPAVARAKNLLAFLAVIGMFVGGIGSFVTVGMPMIGRELEEQSEVFTVSDDIMNELAWQIDITNLDYGYVEIVTSNIEDIRIVSHENEDYPVTIIIDETNRTISVENNASSPRVSVFFLWNLLFQSPGVVIEVPEDMIMESIDVDIRHGNVSIENVQTTRIDIETSNGTVVLRNLVVETDINVNTKNGRIEALNVVSQSLNAQSSNGIVLLERLTIDQVDVQTSNGRIEVRMMHRSDSPGSSLNVVTSNGRIEIEDVYFNRVDGRTSNGDIKYYNEDTSFRLDRLRLSTTNGDIEKNVFEK